MCRNFDIQESNDLQAEVSDFWIESSKRCDLPEEKDDLIYEISSNYDTSIELIIGDSLLLHTVAKTSMYPYQQISWFLSVWDLCGKEPLYQKFT